MDCCCLVGTTFGEDVNDTEEQSVIPAPLRRYDVKLSVTDVVAHGQLTQTFVNPTDQVLEVTYAFPVLPSLTVCGLRAELAGSAVEGRVLAKQAAREEYRAAVASEQTACLLEKPAGDVLRILLGRLPAAAEATITLDFVLELQTQGAGLRLGLPIVVGPRYPLEPLSQEAAADESVALAEASCGPGAAAFSLAVDFEMHCAILGITSPTHTGIRVRSSTSQSSNAAVSAKAIVALELPTMPFREVVLEVALAEPLAPRCWLEPCAPGHDCAAALAVLHPEALDVQHLFPSALPSEPRVQIPTEFIFLLDRSGSMQGDRIQRAAEALQLFLRSLPQGCRFNIVGFGSHHEVLFTGVSVPYDAGSLERASLHAQNVKADLGGTELLRPLQFILDSSQTPGFRRALILLTDGQVSNISSLIGLVQQHDARIYTLGIGSGVSHELVEGLAEAGGGVAEFAISNSERLEAKVARQLGRAIQGDCDSRIRLVRVEWQGASVEALAPAALAGSDAQQCHQQAPNEQGKAAFGGIAWRGERFVVAALLDFAALLDTDSVRLHFAKGSTQTATMDVAVSQPLIGNRLHASVGRGLMEDLQKRFQSLAVGAEEKIAIEAQIVALGTRFQLVSKHTSMVAVDTWSVIDDGPAQREPTIVSCNGPVLRVEFPSGETRVRHASEQATMRWARSKASGEQAAAMTAEIETLYQHAMASAESDLATTHPLRLQASLAFSDFLQDLGRTEEAATIARTAFEDAIAELDNVSEDSYKESTLVMQNLRDSLTCMVAEEEDDSAEQEKAAENVARAAAVVSTSVHAASSPAPVAVRATATTSSAIGAAKTMVTEEDEKPRARDDLHRLLPLQAFDGSWQSSEALAEILCIAPTCFFPKVGASTTAWATALVLAFLQLRLAARSEEWGLLAGKARGSISADGVNAEDLVAQARSFLQKQWAPA